MGDYEDEAEALEERWMDARPDYEAFCRDGALCSDGDGYRDGDYGVRILYLLKEAPVGAYSWCDDGVSMMLRGSDLTSASDGRSSAFWKVLGFRTYIINSIANGNTPSWDGFYDRHDDEGYPLANVACVNIKKGNGEVVSNWRDLAAYARDDCDFINEQIDMLDPHVIVCCGTYQLYQRWICDGDIPKGAQNWAVWDSANGRYVIDMPHPASRANWGRQFRDMVRICEDISSWLEECQ